MASKKGDLGAALAAAAKTLDALGAPWMCIGGLAAIAQGVRRTTLDVDIALRGEALDLDALIKSFARQKVRPRIENPIAFARESQVLLLEHVPSGIEIDLSLAWLSFEHEAIEHAESLAIGTTKVPCARPEDLIIYKLFAGRPKDLQDAETLSLVHRDAIDIERVRRVLEQLANLAGQPEILMRVNGLAGGSTPKKKSHTTSKAKKRTGKPRRV